MEAESRWEAGARYLQVVLTAFVPPASRNRQGRRLVQLMLGLILYGISDSLLVLGRLGLDPWDVFHQGLAKHSAIPIGTWSVVVGVAVLFLWIPLRQRPGIGTLLNAILIGAVMDVILALVAPPHALWLRVLLMAMGVGLNGIATGAYIGAGLGPGPRDGLMVGLAARGYSLRLVRTLIELTVLVAGFLLGGDVGVGTLAYALLIGPLAHIFIPLFSVSPLPRQAGSATGAQV